MVEDRPKHHSQGLNPGRAKVKMVNNLELCSGFCWVESSFAHQFQRLTVESGSAFHNLAVHG